MPKKFIIEDEMHAELLGEFTDFNNAILEITKRIHVPWNEEPNVCPCVSWKTCGRNYQIVEYDAIQNSWKEVKRTTVLEISSKGTKWHLSV